MIKPDNLLTVAATDPNEIIAALQVSGVTGGHFTNGIYAAPAAVVVPTTLAGFKYAADRYARPDDALFILINSDVSMAIILDKKNASAQEREAMEPQDVRADKVAVPLAVQHPDRNVVILFYDTETPTELYDTLAAEGFDMESLFKWGFGTNPDAPKIEGAHNFKRVVAYPFLNDAKAICHDITAVEDQSAFVEVVKLQYSDADRPAYMSADSKLLFPLADSLKKYGPTPPDAAPQPVASTPAPV